MKNLEAKVAIQQGISLDVLLEGKMQEYLAAFQNPENLITEEPYIPVIENGRIPPPENPSFPQITDENALKPYLEQVRHIHDDNLRKQSVIAEHMDHLRLQAETFQHELDKLDNQADADLRDYNIFTTFSQKILRKKPSLYIIGLVLFLLAFFIESMALLPGFLNILGLDPGISLLENFHEDPFKFFVAAGFSMIVFAAMFLLAEAISYLLYSLKNDLQTILKPKQYVKH